MMRPLVTLKRIRSVMVPPSRKGPAYVSSCYFAGGYTRTRAVTRGRDRLARSSARQRAAAYSGPELGFPVDGAACIGDRTRGLLALNAGVNREHVVGIALGIVRFAGEHRAHQFVVARPETGLVG